MPSEPRKILVRAPNWVGDLVMATPALRALRAGFPHARICVAVREGLEPLLEGSPRIDEIVILRNDRKGPSARLREAAALRSRRFDLGLALPDSFSAALFLRMAGVRHAVGYARDGRRFLLHRAVSLPGEAKGRPMLAREHHVLGLVEAIGVRSLGTSLELFVTPAESRAVERLLRERGVEAGARLAVLAPGASYGDSKRWPVGRFAAVGDLLARAGATVLWVGSPSEAPLLRQAMAAMQSPSHALGSELGLGGLKALLERSRLLVCNDAGARHVAVAFGTPCVMMIGPTSLAKTSENLERVRVLAADVECRPCYLRTCPIDHRCMTRIEIERVAAAALPALRDDAEICWRGGADLDGVRTTARAGSPGGGS